MVTKKMLVLVLERKLVVSSFFVLVLKGMLAMARFTLGIIRRMQ